MPNNSFYNEDGEPIIHVAPFSEFGTYTTSENIILLKELKMLPIIMII